jgi:FixJ family two-component response regulator
MDKFLQPQALHLEQFSNSAYPRRQTMSDSDQPTVVVIDDDESVRESLRGLLETVSVNVALFRSVEAFLSANPPVLPSCIVLDVRLPGASGFELQKQLVAAEVDTPVIFITGHGDIPMSVRAMKAGAIEFLSKPFRDQELLDAVRQGVERHRASVAQRRAWVQIRKRFAGLTDREKEIMTLLARGRVSKQIADQIGISEVTVRVHRGQIMQKMGARSLADLVRMADRLEADGGNAVNPVAEDTYDGLPRSSRTAKRVTYVTGKQKGRDKPAK